nr:protein POLYCHOME-like [Ipomoea batatas]
MNQGFETMLEGRDRLSRPVDIAEVYRRRVTGIDIDADGIVHVVRDDVDDLGAGSSPFRWGGAVGAGSAAAAARVIGRENMSHTGRRPVRAPRGSALPSWYPRRPLKDITYITTAYQRRRERLREGEPGTPLLRDPTVATPSAILNEVKDQNAQDYWEFQKLLQRTPSAKKAEREKRVKTLMSMR